MIAKLFGRRLPPLYRLVGYTAADGVQTCGCCREFGATNAGEVYARDLGRKITVLARVGESPAEARARVFSHHSRRT